MTSILPVDLAGTAGTVGAASSALARSVTPFAAGERDAALTSLADTLPILNQLQSLASVQSNAPATAALPVATPPNPQQQTQAQQAVAQPAFAGDFYTDGDDGL